MNGNRRASRTNSRRVLTCVHDRDHIEEVRPREEPEWWGAVEAAVAAEERIRRHDLQTREARVRSAGSFGGRRSVTPEFHTYSNI
jgi:hypothetical protein